MTIRPFLTLFNTKTAFLTLIGGKIPKKHNGLSVKGAGEFWWGIDKKNTLNELCVFLIPQMIFHNLSLSDQLQVKVD